MMKKVFIIIFSFISLFSIASNVNYADSISKAQKLYEQQDFVGSIEIYNFILDAGYESAEVFYNLANSYYKNNQLAYAILNYERALLRNPKDFETIDNIEIVRSQQIDKIDAIPDFFLAIWMRSFFQILTSNAWTILSLIFLVILLTGFYLYLYSVSISVKKLTFGIGVFFSLFFLISIYGAVSQKNLITSHNKAIVITPTVTAKSTPNDTGKNLFVIHEGLKVEILDELSGYVRIKLSNGEIGWVLENDIVII